MSKIQPELSSLRGNTAGNDHPEQIAAIEAVGLTKSFGKNLVVKDIDLKVKPGEIYGLLGPNGAGKTTLLRMMSTLIPIDKGTSHILGYDVVKQAHQVRERLGVTGQTTSVEESLTASENIYLFARLRGLTRKAAKQRSAELLEEFTLADVAKQSVATFSGGMRRRLDLAVSLITRPPVIFLDEPTTGLDPRTRNQMWEVVREIVSNGNTILLTTQYLDEADQLADRIGVLDQGRIVAEGTSDQLKATVGHSTLVLTLLEGTDPTTVCNIIESKGQGIPILSMNNTKISMPVNDYTLAIDALLALRESKVPIETAGIQKPTLDEVFLTLTERTTKEEQVSSL